MPSFKEIYRQEPIRDKGFVMPFGRHKGLTLGECMTGDPGWLMWLHNHTDLELHSDIIDELEDTGRGLEWLVETSWD